MANSYYNHGGYPATQAPGSSAAMRAELDQVAAGFDRLPLLGGNAGQIVVVNAAANGLTTTGSGLSDATFSLYDDVDNTKIGRFQLSGITTGQTRVLTWPDASTTIVGTNAVQTLTNKTFGDTVVINPGNLLVGAGGSTAAIEVLRGAAAVAELMLRGNAQAYAAGFSVSQNASNQAVLLNRANAELLLGANNATWATLTGAGLLGLNITPTAGLHVNNQTGSYIGKFERPGVASRLAFYSSVNQFFVDAEGASNQLSLSQNGAVTMQLDASGRIFTPRMHNNAGGYAGATQFLGSNSTFAPAASALTNTAGVAFGPTRYTRVGNIVTMSGTFSCAATAAGSFVGFDMTVPISGSGALPAAGVLNCSIGEPAARPGGGISNSSSTTVRVIIQVPGTTNNLTYTYTLQYEVV